MNSLVVLLLGENSMLTSRRVRERGRPSPDLGSITALWAKRLTVKLAVTRHLPRPDVALKRARQVMTKLAGRTEQQPRRDRLLDTHIVVTPC
ncbi:hypothetical protein [Novosphingobium sp. JCM 18896]|uniref:hypothetical protein n=1 Tax=Novosphingobium sp. JCM 18896 TaxID=2989731 RepID=UPI0022235FED|nr:hypothetical protein [Novosphingobium sp. JCM 18896]MCW1431890.1 hypothetical protein [Novosphingobium sp. JCM 18896]